jgi:hypothetical protein
MSHGRYSAALALHGTTLAPYYLDEESNWGLSIPHLREQTKKVRSYGSSLEGVQVTSCMRFQLLSLAAALLNILLVCHKRASIVCRQRQMARRCGRWW